MPVTECLTHSKTKKGQTMPVIEDIKIISETIGNIIDFVKTVERLSPKEKPIILNVDGLK